MRRKSGGIFSSVGSTKNSGITTASDVGKSPIRNVGLEESCLNRTDSYSAFVHAESKNVESITKTKCVHQPRPTLILSGIESPGRILVSANQTTAPRRRSRSASPAA